MFEGHYLADSTAEGLVVAVNSGDQTARIRIDEPLLAGSMVRQVAWPGLDWQTAFEPQTLEAGGVEFEIRAREGLIVEVVRP
jgi:hypothetical protein